METYSCDACGAKESPFFIHIWMDLDEMMYAEVLDDLGENQVCLDDEGSAYANLVRPDDAQSLEGYTLCTSCMSKKDVDYIKALPLQDLPLYVNQVWITEEGSQTYQARLQSLDTLKS